MKEAERKLQQFRRKKADAAMEADSLSDNRRKIAAAAMEDDSLSDNLRKKAAAAIEADSLFDNYVLESKHVSGRRWTEIRFVDETLKAKTVLVRGQIQTSRAMEVSSIQCVLTVADNLSGQMVKFATSLSKEFNVDIEGIVSVPDYPIKRATQNVELQITKIYCFNKALPTLPFNIFDPARSEDDNKKDTCLNFRVLYVCTPANQQMFRIQCQVETEFRQYLLSEGFLGIDTPKITAGSSEGGALMTICWGFGSVFEFDSVFRAEKSHNLIYLCEFIGLDLEMEIKEHYSKVMDIVDGLFVATFHSLNEKCKKELEAIGNQYPIEPLKYLRKTLRLTFEEGVQMLKEADVEVNPLRDLNTELKRKLGKIVLKKYGTEFYILHRYPTAVRPFYTMPCYDNPSYINSFDVFIRGEEIISGSQRVHDPKLLSTRSQSCGIDLKSIEAYIDAFRNGTDPHGGFGVGLERVVMLFCGLNNIFMIILYRFLCYLA
ncbi:hypothetical protein MKW98_004806 [Papaver atlanticum]|uniref:aspartate--tRNA ligase n=1 Tax=Papaver atlanticum TaxID=357466 RepID=A0AAD4S6I7_9MAGN|nr:hypothetical protein MKW98_004806 [Papaver atlanticum]